MSKAPPGWPRLQRDWVGLRVKLKRRLWSGLMTIPAGTVCTVVETTIGRCRLTTDACPACGVAVHISRVAPFDLTLVES
jgi:hypothetical protein